MSETTNQDDTSVNTQLHLMSEELEEATNKFLLEIAELEKLLCQVEE
jgi:hypothetical protein